MDYAQLAARANESLTLDRMNPTIRAQADAYSAQQDRSERNYISDAAERMGPNANIEGVRRMAAEHAGIASGQFEAGLMGQELQARRAEIASALAQMGGQLSAEQTNTLQRELGLIDAKLKEYGLGITSAGQNALWDYNWTFGRNE